MEDSPTNCVKVEDEQLREILDIQKATNLSQEEIVKLVIGIGVDELKEKFQTQTTKSRTSL